MTRSIALERLIRDIGGARDAHEIYEPTLSALQTIIGVDRSSILLLDERGVARFVASRGISEAYRRAAEGHFPWAVDDPSPQPVLISDVQRSPSLTPLLPLFESEGIRALAFIPLVYRGRLVGKFMLYFREPHVFADDEVSISNTLAALIAFAIERTRLYAQLEESDRRKDIFLATLAHELRNPLAPVSAALALMREHPGDLEMFGKVQAQLERSFNQIVKLVDDLLDVSRITRGVIAIVKKPVDLTNLVHHAILAVQPLIASQGHELTLSLEPLSVEADALRVEQVITNLVHNAAKYTPAGGHIWISTRASDGGIEIRVRDDGIGIEPDEIPRLFDLFMQVDRSLARTRGGLGVGLTIVRELVHLHGGRVHATSAGLGKGSEFTVWLPGRVETREALTAKGQHVRGPSRRVLVVDDNEDAANMLVMLLQDWGHEAKSVPDGATALAAVEQHHPDVVLLDLGLPDISGYEVAKQLRAKGETGPRVVAVSGYGQPEDIARALAAGCDGHLAKPVDLGALDQLLASASPAR